ncbi:MAG: YybH family protein [Phycisphaerae bacterium]
MRRFTMIAISGPWLAGCTSVPGGQAIREVLDRQVAAWNAGDIEGFMSHYWHSEELTFVSVHQEQDPATGINRPVTTMTRGWQATLDRYRQRYPTSEAMGTLSFSELAVSRTSGDAARVKGRYRLDRKHDIPTGRFTLDMRRIEGAWRIVRDWTVSDGFRPSGED